jgi:Holliday junction resolvase RusA-like endonuclease
MLNLEIPGIPKPKQSARFRISKNGAGKQFISSYQNKDVKDAAANIAFIVLHQLPKGFIPYDCPVAARIEYVFPIPSSFSKKQKEAVLRGKIIYKDTKPDLTDNLNKGLIDALAGIVYINDSRIASTTAVKYYGSVPKTVVWFKELPAEDDEVQFL